MQISGLRKRTRIALTTFAAMAVFATSALTVLAYNDADPISCWWYNPQGQSLMIQWRFDAINTSGEWARAYERASNSWTATPTKIIMNYNSSAASTANTYYDPTDSRGGFANYWCNWWNWTMAHFNAYGNVAYNSDSGGENIWRNATAAHEFGHGLALGHSYDANAVMYKWENRGVYVPAADDVAGLNAMYPW
jgi:predicted Zn-dependent protease